MRFLFYFLKALSTLQTGFRVLCGSNSDLSFDVKKKNNNNNQTWIPRFVKMKIDDGISMINSHLQKKKEINL